MERLADQSARADDLLSVRVRARGDGSVVLTVDGELDGLGAPVLEQVLDVVWSAAPSRVVLDLRAVGYLNGRGLRVLLGARHVAGERQLDLVLWTSTGLVPRLLARAGLEDLVSRVDAGARVTVRSRPRRSPTSPGLRPVGACSALPTAAGTGARLVAVPDPALREAAAPSRYADPPPLVTTEDLTTSALRWMRDWDAARGLDATLAAIAAQALVVLPGADAACASVPAAAGAPGSWVVAGQPAAVRALRWGQGTPAASLTHGSDVGVHHLADGSSCPALLAACPAGGVSSSLTLCLGPARPPCTLTLVAARPAAFGPHLARAGEVFAAVAGVALAAAVREDRLNRVLDGDPGRAR